MCIRDSFPVIGEDEEGEMIPLDAEKVLSIPRKIKSKEVVRMGFQMCIRDRLLPPLWRPSRLTARR